MTKKKYCPAALGPAGQALVDSITNWSPDGTSKADFRPDELALIRLAGEAADKINALTRLADGEPMFVIGPRGMQVVAPVLVELRGWNRQLAALLKQLHMTDGEASDWDSMTASQRARRAATIRWTG